MNEGPLSPNLDGSDTEMLDRIQKETFEYYVGEVNAANGLVADSTQPGSPSSIAVVGLALTAYPVGVERGFWTREEAAARTATTLSFFERSSQGPEADATGYRGFYSHFLDMKLIFAGFLRADVAFDNTVRPDQALDNHCPRPGQMQPSALRHVVAIPQVDGRHHRDTRGA